MNDSFDPTEVSNAFKQLLDEDDFFVSYIENLRRDGLDSLPVEECVKDALAEFTEGVKSFVIYGEPQSGKTSMMIALTDRILNSGFDTVVILLNDSLRLLKQNLDRFTNSCIRPTPVSAVDLVNDGIELENMKYILFCKKNAQDLRKLIRLISNRTTVIIDDEADYATPNGKINKKVRSKVNELVLKLKGEKK